MDNGHSKCFEHRLHSFSVKSGTVRRLYGILSITAISSVHSYSQGNPRLIDNVMTDAMTIGNQMEKKVIDADVMLAAINNQTLS